jgi:hypothetical protein
VAQRRSRDRGPIIYIVRSNGSRQKSWPFFYDLSTDTNKPWLARLTKAIEVRDEIISQASEWIQAPKNFTV